MTSPINALSERVAEMESAEAEMLACRLPPIDLERCSRSNAEIMRVEIGLPQLVRDLFSALQEAQKSRQWLPIESAPKDGVKILAYSPGKKSASLRRATVPHIHVDSFSHEWPSAHHQYPESPYTHWMPLPTPPDKLPED